MSYEAMTPSAARNILQAIYWKPEMNYVVRQIHVLNPVKFVAFKLNEISTKAQIDVVQKYREQTNNMVLKDVRYGIVADIVPITDNHDDLLKHSEMFHRRASKGQSFANPYLGLREFLAIWELVDKIPVTSIPQDQATKPLGPMLLDFRYVEDRKGKVIPKRVGPTPNIKKNKYRMDGVFFSAMLENGIINVPEI
jgi:CRISPR-associated protein Cas5d